MRRALGTSGRPNRGGLRLETRRAAGRRAAVLIAAWLAAACSSGERAAPVPPAAAPAVEEQSGNGVTFPPEAQRSNAIAVREVQIRTLPETVRVTGRITINENQTWRVGAVTSGRIVQLFVREGDPVAKGQVLARMHSHDIHEARAAYQRARAELDRLNANLSYTRGVRDRTRRLLELKAASLQQLEQAEAALRDAETSVSHGEVELERTRLHLVDFLRIPVEAPPHSHGQPDDDYDLIPIAAPAAGTLLRRAVTPGTVVEPSNELFVITDLSTLWTMSAVSEDHLPKLRIGMPAQVYVQAYPGRSFPGRLVQLDTQLDPATRTIMARVETPNGRGLLKPEMYATVEMELGGTREAIFVPEVAVQEIEGESAVFVQTASDRFEPRRVVTAPGLGGAVEIASGLTPGDRVVVEGSFLLKSQLLKSSLAEEE